jgi:hypothetical protein
VLSPAGRGAQYPGLVSETKKISTDSAVRASLKVDMPIALVAIDQIYQAYRLADDQLLAEATTSIQAN